MRNAADKDEPVAEFSLGMAYYMGAGVPKDSKQALDWLQKSANHGGGSKMMADGLIAQIQKANAGSPSGP